MTDPQQAVLETCKKHYEAFKKDCSGFVRAVAAELGHPLAGNADNITAEIDVKWTKLVDGAAAAKAAGEGKFVVAALAGKDHVPTQKHGHIVVVIDGELYHGIYPKCWGGSLGNYQSMGDKSVGEVWNKTSRDRVIYRQAPAT